MKQQVRDFHEKMGQTGPQTNNNNQSATPQPHPKPKTGDYIDFEEIRK
jgi:hypothetical protein